MFEERAARAWLDDLNDAQRAAVTHAGGPLLILAGAGTGKTTTLCSRMAWLLAEGIPAERILLLTFSRRASREMLARAGRLVDRSRTGKVWGGTFHATANRLLRIYGRALGLSPDFTVLDQADMADRLEFLLAAPLDEVAELPVLGADVVRAAQHGGSSRGSKGELIISSAQCRMYSPP